mmetsp:Transcript_16176/g.33326  ORF Transcript_16176/g.33326 Transcript_16176/m.33326 type:complete len:370 (-) Transcript_16176:51-1160(-)
MSGKKKSKAVTVPLNSFLAEEDDGNWANMEDDEDPQDLPSSGYDDDGYGNDDRYNRGREDRYEKPDRRRYEDRPSRIDAPQKPLPDGPPYVAFVGNLSYEVDDNALGEFFSEHCEVKDVRVLVDNQTQRSKGFGYVTFENIESLETALKANGFELLGRAIRVDVAEGRNEPEPRREPRVSRADQVDKWERGKTVATPQERPGRSDSRDRKFGGRDDRRRDDRRRDDRFERKERKPLNLQPRSSDSPVNSPAQSSSKASPFGGAKPRDELEFQRRKEEERKQRAKETAQRREPQKNSPKPGNKPKSSFQKRDNKTRDFGALRDNMGKQPPRSEKSDKEKKPYKPQTVQKDSSTIPVKNIFSALAQDNEDN